MALLTCPAFYGDLLACGIAAFGCYHIVRAYALAIRGIARGGI